MNEEINLEQLETYIKENLKVERRITLSLTYHGKEYAEQVSVEQLFKVYERVSKKELVFLHYAKLFSVSVCSINKIVKTKSMLT